MGVYKFESETSSPIPPARMFKALILESDTLIPKLVPQVESSEIIEGDGGPGSIRKITFNEGGKVTYVKHKLEGIDKEHFSFTYSVIEGHAEFIEKICYESKFIATPDGGCICKNVSTYYTKGDVELKEEDIASGRQKATGLAKAVEAYLLANPDACN